MEEKNIKPIPQLKKKIIIKIEQNFIFKFSWKHFKHTAVILKILTVLCVFPKSSNSRYTTGK